MVAIEVDGYKISLNTSDLIGLKRDLQDLVNRLSNSEECHGYPSSYEYIVSQYPGLAALMKAFNVLEEEDELPF